MHYLTRMFNSPRVTMLAHADAFYQAVSPIQRCSSLPEMIQQLSRQSQLQASINRHALVPFLIFSYVIIDTAVAFVGDRFLYTADAMADTFLHKLWARVTWNVTDVITVAAIFMSYSIYVCFLCYPGLDRRAVIYAIANGKGSADLYSNGKAFGREESVYLYQHFGRFRRIFRYTFYAIAILLETFFLSQFLLINFAYTLKDYIILCVLPMALIYLGYSNFALIAHFIITARCIGLRGRRQISKLQKLIMDSLVQGSPSKIEAKYVGQQRKFHSISAAILREHEEIRLFNAFWSRILTDYFAIYILELCYFSYHLLFFWSEMPTFNIVFNLCIAIIFIIVQCTIVNECRTLLHNNSEAFKLKRRFQLWSVRFDKSKRNLFKFDAFEANQSRFVRTGFTLLDGLLLSSKMFEMVLLYTSTFFMMICRHRLQKI